MYTYIISSGYNIVWVFFRKSFLFASCLSATFNFNDVPRRGGLLFLYRSTSSNLHEKRHHYNHHHHYQKRRHIQSELIPMASFMCCSGCSGELMLLKLMIHMRNVSQSEHRHFRGYLYESWQLYRISHM